MHEKLQKAESGWTGMWPGEPQDTKAAMEPLWLSLFPCHKNFKSSATWKSEQDALSYLLNME